MDTRMATRPHTGHTERGRDSRVVPPRAHTHTPPYRPIDHARHGPRKHVLWAFPGHMCGPRPARQTNRSTSGFTFSRMCREWGLRGARAPPEGEGGGVWASCDGVAATTQAGYNLHGLRQHHATMR